MLCDGMQCTAAAEGARACSRSATCSSAAAAAGAAPGAAAPRGGGGSAGLGGRRLGRAGLHGRDTPQGPLAAWASAEMTAFHDLGVPPRRHSIHP